jgi:hypothetical protein
MLPQHETWQEKAIGRLELDIEATHRAALKLQAHESLDLEVRMIFAELAQSVNTEQDD